MIDKLLEERGTRYGTFAANAEIAQKIKGVLHSHPNWESMPFDNRQALDVIFDKVARMMTGDPDYLDSWNDIIGYATLVANRIKNDERDSSLINLSQDNEVIKRAIDELERNKPKGVGTRDYTE